MEKVIEFALAHPLNVGAFAVMLGLWGLHEFRRTGKSVTAADLVKRINMENVLVVDIRAEHAYNKGCIASAISCPLERIEELPALSEKHKDKEVILVCGTGRDSANAQRILQKKKFTASRLAGGLVEWTVADLPLVK